MSFCCGLNALSFGPIIYWLLRHSLGEQTAARATQGAKLKDILAERRLRLIIIMTAASACFGGPFEAQLPAIAVHTLHGGSVLVSVLSSCCGLGVMAGIVLVRHRPQEAQLVAMIVACDGLFGLAGTLIEPTSSLYAKVFCAVMCIFVQGSLSFMFVSVSTEIQVSTDDSIRGSVLSVYYAAINAVAIGQLGFGFIAQSFGFQNALLIEGYILGACLFWSMRHWHRSNLSLL